MSPNGMVRPCSCLAAFEASKGLSPRTLSDTRAAMLIPFGAKSSKPKIAEHRGRKTTGDGDRDTFTLIIFGPTADQRDSRTERDFGSGSSLRFDHAVATSAVHPGADISLRRTNRRFGPISDIADANANVWSLGPRASPYRAIMLRVLEAKGTVMADTRKLAAILAADVVGYLAHDHGRPQNRHRGAIRHAST